MWAKLEEQVGIMATSLPWLRSPAENWLKNMGLLNEHQLTKPSIVADMSLPTFKDLDEEGSSGELESAKAKGNVRVDSVAVALGPRLLIQVYPKVRLTTHGGPYERPDRLFLYYFIACMPRFGL
jgi:hypothetical protein